MVATAQHDLCLAAVTAQVVLSTEWGKELTPGVAQEPPGVLVPLLSSLLGSEEASR